MTCEYKNKNKNKTLGIKEIQEFETQQTPAGTLSEDIQSTKSDSNQIWTPLDTAKELEQYNRYV